MAPGAATSPAAKLSGAERSRQHGAEGRGQPDIAGEIAQVADPGLGAHLAQGGDASRQRLQPGQRVRMPGVRSDPGVEGRSQVILGVENPQPTGGDVRRADAGRQHAHRGAAPAMRSRPPAALPAPRR